MSYKHTLQSIRRRTGVSLRLMLIGLMALPGCALRPSDHMLVDADMEHYKSAATAIEYPDVVSDNYVEIASTPAPITIENVVNDFVGMGLEEAIQTALANSTVMRDLGGQLLEFPESEEIVQTALDPAIIESDPRFGVEAALSAFDAQLKGSAFFEGNDRALNNVFFGGGTRILRQDLHTYQAEISKRAATGGEFAIRKIIDYDLNNQPGNSDPNLPWQVQLETEFRQPLLQGAGVDFNRIAGPNATPGAMNGVLISRINTDISLSNFESGIRDLVNDVENAYWELYYAYRDLDAKIEARDRALVTWRSIHNLFVNGQRGGETDREAQSRASYYRLEEEVQNALTGRLEDKNRTVAFRGVGGVHTAERRLRLMLGLPLSDGKLIRPTDEPMMAKVIFDWEEVLAEGLIRRVELRQQKWRIQQRELELIASRNFLMPRIDAVGRYRFRGLGQDLLNSTRDRMQFDNAYQTLTTGDFQEWQLGVEVEVPLGYRQAHSAVRNAELLLSRERAILAEQERMITHDLSAAISEVARAYATSQTNYNRRIAVTQQLEALQTLYEEADPSEQNRLFDLLLDAQRRLTDAETRYYRSMVEYALSIKNVHMQKGSLLEYNQIFLTEGPWPGKAYFDSTERDYHRRRPPRLLNYMMTKPWPLSRGRFEQRVSEGDGVMSPQEYIDQLNMPESMEELPIPVIDPPSSASDHFAPEGDNTAQTPAERLLDDAPTWSDTEWLPQSPVTEGDIEPLFTPASVDTSGIGNHFAPAAGPNWRPPVDVAVPAGERQTSQQSFPVYGESSVVEPLIDTSAEPVEVNLNDLNDTSPPAPSRNSTSNFVYPFANDPLPVSIAPPPAEVNLSDRHAVPTERSQFFQVAPHVPSPVSQHVVPAAAEQGWPVAEPAESVAPAVHVQSETFSPWAGEAWMPAQ